MAKGLNKTVTWLSLAHFTTDTYSGFLNPIMPFIAANLGISMGIAALVMSISQLIAQLIQPIFGFFADNIFKRVFIFWGLMFAAIFFPLTACSKNLGMLILFVILGSLGVSIFHPQSIGFVIRFTKEDFTRNMGIFLSLGSIGYSFGPAISSAVMEYIKLEAMPITSIAGVILALLMFACVPKISNTDKKPEKKDIIQVFKTILTNKQILILILIAIMKAIISSSCAILLPFFWKDTGYSPVHIGMALFWFMLAGGFGSLLSPKFEKLVGTRNTIYISMLSMPVMMFIFVFATKTYPVLAFIDFVLMAFVLMLATPITMVLAQKELPQYKSIIGGFLNGFCWGIVGGVLSGLGFIAQKFGVLQILMIASILPALSIYFVKDLKIEEK
ncbi:MFS transporter [bacterium]|nr:MFS transporter [bacterium]